MIGTTNLPPNVTSDTLTAIVRLFDAFAKSAVHEAHEAAMRKVIKRGTTRGLANKFCFIINDVAYAGTARIVWEHGSDSVIRVKNFQLKDIEAHADGMKFTASHWRCFQNVRNRLY
jgi:hypothetical protein